MLRFVPYFMNNAVGDERVTKGGSVFSGEYVHRSVSHTTNRAFETTEAGSEFRLS